jgi:quinol-cytochrome oxidoreductase complex cytochrome b subunit
MRFLDKLGNFLCIVLGCLVVYVFVFEQYEATIGRHTIDTLKWLFFFAIFTVVLNGLTAVATQDNADDYRADYTTTVILTALVTVTTIYVVAMMYIGGESLRFADFPRAKLFLFGLLIAVWVLMVLSAAKHQRMSRSLAAQRAAPPVLPNPAPLPLAAAPAATHGNGVLWTAVVVVLLMMALFVFRGPLTDFWKDMWADSGLSQLASSEKVCRSAQFAGFSDGLPKYKWNC